MAEKKLEEIIDFLAEYGGFDREYLRDKLLTFANDGRLETKNKADKQNKMEAVARLFGKKLGEEFVILTPTGKLRKVKFTADRGLLYYDNFEQAWNKNFGYLNFLCEGKAVIVDE